MAIKEKVKKYIQANYPKCSIAEVAEKFGCSMEEVEEFYLEEMNPKKVISEKNILLSEKNISLKKEKKNLDPKKSSIFNAINKILIILLLLCLAILVFGLNTSQMSNNDIWMHLKNGELILKNHQFLYKDTYSFRTIGKDWMSHEWLAGVIFYLVNKIYHVNALIFFKGFLVLILALFLVAACRLTKNRWFILYPMVVFALFNAGVRFLDRPHIFTFLFTPVFIYILFAYKYRQKDYLYWLPVLSLLWVNIHGGYIAGIGIIGLFAFFETIRTLINRYSSSFRQNDILPMSKIKKLWIILALSVLVLSLNPYTFRIYTYPFKLTTQKTFMTQLYEWQPPFKSPTFMKSYAFIYFLIWMAILGISFLLNSGEFDLTNLALSGFFLALSLKMHREIGTAVLATTPIITLNFDRFFDYLVNKYNQNFRLTMDLVAKSAILLITVGLTIVTFKYGYIYRAGSRKPFGLGVASNMPVDAVQYIKEKGIKGNCFNPYTYGTYLIYHLYPETRVVMDSRGDLPYGEDLYLEHQYAMSHVKPFKAMFKKYHIDYILLNYRQNDLTEHFKYLDETGEWVLVYFDDQNLVYVRNTEENKKLIEEDGYLVLHPVLTFSRGGIETKDITRCIAECEQSLKRNPHLTTPRFILQNIYASQGNLDLATKEGEKMVEIEPENRRGYLLLGDIYRKKGELEKAAHSIMKAIELDPQEISGYLFLGDIYQKMNKPDQAKASYLKALEINPDNSKDAVIKKKLQELGP